MCVFMQRGKILSGKGRASEAVQRTGEWACLQSSTRDCSEFYADVGLDGTERSYE